MFLFCDGAPDSAANTLVSSDNIGQVNEINWWRTLAYQHGATHQHDHVIVYVDEKFYCGFDLNFDSSQRAQA